jgi:hypothetical protein
LKQKKLPFRRSSGFPISSRASAAKKSFCSSAEFVTVVDVELVKILKKAFTTEAVPSFPSNSFIKSLSVIFIFFPLSVSAGKICSKILITYCFSTQNQIRIKRRNFLRHTFCGLGDLICHFVKFSLFLSILKVSYKYLRIEKYFINDELFLLTKEALFFSFGVPSNV